MDKNIAHSSDVSPFEYQIAGHSVKSGTGNIGMLKHKDGYILKPINKIPQGDVEIAFYERLKNDKDLFPIKRFIPEYLGFVNMQLNNTDIRFLKLNDITNGFLKPCLMDVKIGKQTWDPQASLEKRTAEDAKYVESKKEYGFCIPGYVVFNILTKKFEKCGKEDGKKLGKETTIHAFKHFFNLPCQHSHIVIKHMINTLIDLQSWWKIQRVVHIFSSSILLAYDGGILKEITEDTGSKTASNINNWVKVYMIDFAHVFPAQNKEDFNYLMGLSNLIDVLQLILN